jgi:5'-3' exoribonuclease 2
VLEELPVEVTNADGSISKIPIDARGPNPNGEEFDNLYLDMNGIVHPCSHPEDRPAPETEEDMMVAVFEYTERVLNMVRPRKLLMIAVDGVAPRAKMNQQRSRRFRSAQEAAEKDKAAQEFHADQVARGIAAERDGTEDGPKKTWDSNSITPGTPFMDLLAASLRYWISYKLTTDPSWANLKIIISDATVPGEGEHKIMNFIRSQRVSPDHDPNTRHVMYGLDADLIMLGIATHEPHFRVLREDVFANDTKPGHCRKCNQPGHIAAQCQGKPAPKPEDALVVKPLKPFIWLHVSILREYLAIEMNVPNSGFAFDLERALDDWVFMCFFVGNDFLPHLPSLDIREDGIDTLIAIWRDNLPVMGGYVTKDGHVDLSRAQLILQGLAKQEDAIFKRRRQNEVRQEERNQRNQRQNRGNPNKKPRMSDGGNGAPTGYDETIIRRGPKGGIIRGEAAPDINALQLFAPGAAQTRNDPRYAATLTHADVVGGSGASIKQANQDNRSAAAALKERLAALGKSSDTAVSAEQPAASALGKRTRDLADEAADEINTDPSTPGRNTPNREIADPKHRGASGALGGNSNNESDGLPEDTVMLWEDGYQNRYYEQKFHASPDDIEFRHQVARHYVEGLAWVLLYYFQGCPSWTWYYPYHYAPFAEDFVDLDKFEINFEKGKPFRPYEQLMGVLPAASNHAIPEAFHSLMTDEDSPVIDFYPEEFQIDMNGKKMAWQGIALLPFIDPKRLLDAMATRYPLLSEDEKRRNAPGAETLLFSTRHPLYNEIVGRFYGKKAEDSEIKINSRTSQGLSGKVSKDDSYVPSSSLEFPFASESSGEFKSLDADESARVTYHMPVLRSAHKSMLLPGVKFAASMLDYNDVSQTRNRAERSGRTHGGVQLSRNGDRSDGQRINYAARDQQDNGRHNNGGNGYNANGAYGRGGQYRNDNNNPLAHLPPGLAAQAAQHGFVPGGPPPPFQGNGNGYGYPGQAPRQSGYGSRGGYNGYSGGQSRGGSYGYGNSNGHHGGGGGYGRGRRY